MAKIHRRIYKKDINDLDIDGVVSHLQLDILECEVKWALGSITRNKASGGDEIPAELFQLLKNDAVKVLHSICQQIWKTQQWLQDWTRSVFIPIPKKWSEVTQSCPTLCNPMDYSLLSSQSMGFSRQEYWSGLPFPCPKKGSAKECSNYHTTAFIHMLLM